MAEKTAEELLTEQEAAIEAAKKAKGKYTVLRPIEHDLKLRPVGSVVQLSGEQAAPLLAQRAIEVATKEVPL